MLTPELFQSVFGKNFLKRAVRLDAGDGCIDFGHTFVAFAEGQTELAPADAS